MLGLPKPRRLDKGLRPAVQPGHSTRAGGSSSSVSRSAAKRRQACSASGRGDAAAGEAARRPETEGVPMKVLFVARFGPVLHDRAVGTARFLDTLGSALNSEDGAYFHTER